MKYSPTDLHTGQSNSIQRRSFTTCISPLPSSPNCITVFDIETPKVTFTLMAYAPDEAGGRESPRHLVGSLSRGAVIRLGRLHGTTGKLKAKKETLLCEQWFIGG